MENNGLPSEGKRTFNDNNSIDQQLTNFPILLHPEIPLKYIMLDKRSFIHKKIPILVQLRIGERHGN